MSHESNGRRRARPLRRPRIPMVAIAAILTAVLAACGPQPAADAQAAGAQTAAGGRASDDDLPAVLAKVGGDAITLDQVREQSGGELDQLESTYLRKRHDIVESAVHQMLRERLFTAEAAKTGASIEELLAREAGGSLEPSEEEIAAWYRDNPDRVGGRPLAQVHAAISDFLARQRGQNAAKSLEERLEQEQGVVVNIGPYRERFDNDGAPERGPADAPITLVEFSDFQCPFCGRFFSTLQQVEKEFGDTVRVVYRQFPLPSLHPDAQKAAEASLCAQEQGKFWEMHDLMFQEQDRLGVADLKEKAGRLGLAQQDFDQCLDSGRMGSRISADQREGQRVGVNGTPALFVNGVVVEGGAVPYEAVSAAIHEELQRQKSGRP